MILKANMVDHLSHRIEDSRNLFHSPQEFFVIEQ